MTPEAKASIRKASQGIHRGRRLSPEVSAGVNPLETKEDVVVVVSPRMPNAEFLMPTALIF
jgi:hypothetical protein